jgi:predicted nucleic acid-binding protein
VSYLLDTNVLSELLQRRPADAVLRWFDATPEEALHVSVLTFGEIRRGVERLHASPRKERLRLWLEQALPERFEGRVLPVTSGVADRWGRLLAATGRTLPAIDGLLAATALHYELRMVTRNVADFALPGLDVIDPWARADR